VRAAPAVAGARAAAVLEATRRCRLVVVAAIVSASRRAVRLTGASVLAGVLATDVVSADLVSAVSGAVAGVLAGLFAADAVSTAALEAALVGVGVDGPIGVRPVGIGSVGVWPIGIRSVGVPQVRVSGGRLFVSEPAAHRREKHTEDEEENKE
jgi:hypothetical protein